MARWSLEEAAQGRKEYVNRVRESFSPPAGVYGAPEPEAGREGEAEGASGFWTRALIAALLFAAFVYCDRENVAFWSYGSEAVVSQIEWEMLPTEEIRDMIRIEGNGAPEGKEKAEDKTDERFR